MNGTLLIIADQQQGQLHPLSLEVLVAGQQLAAKRLVLALVGSGVAPQVESLQGLRLDEIWIAEHDLLAAYTAEAQCAALRQLVDRVQPALVLMPHSYQVRDYGPKLAASYGRSLISDCSGFSTADGQLSFVRQVFQGKFWSQVRPGGEIPQFVSLQVGAFSAKDLEPAVSLPEVKALDVTLDPTAILSRPREAQAAVAEIVNLAEADVIVAVGRAIKGPEQLRMAERLAELLGGQVGATRAVCDEGWLPIERQIGSSGQIVAPRLYIALGVSGAIQHLVGMKGAATVVAVNKDPEAPIFSVADYGIVGDIFEVVPALISELEAAS